MNDIVLAKGIDLDDYKRLVEAYKNESLFHFPEGSTSVRNGNGSSIITLLGIPGNERAILADPGHPYAERAVKIFHNIFYPNFSLSEDELISEYY